MVQFGILSWTKGASFQSIKKDEQTGPERQTDHLVGFLFFSYHSGPTNIKLQNVVYPFGTNFGSISKISKFNYLK